VKNSTIAGAYDAKQAANLSAAALPDKLNAEVSATLQLNFDEEDAARSYGTADKIEAHPSPEAALREAEVSAAADKSDTDRNLANADAQLRMLGQVEADNAVRDEKIAGMDRNTQRQRDSIQTGVGPLPASQRAIDPEVQAIAASNAYRAEYRAAAGLDTNDSTPRRSGLGGELLDVAEYASGGVIRFGIDAGTGLLDAAQMASGPAGLYNVLTGSGLGSRLNGAIDGFFPETESSMFMNGFRDKELSIALNVGAVLLPGGLAGSAGKIGGVPNKGPDIPSYDELVSLASKDLDFSTKKNGALFWSTSSDSSVNNMLTAQWYGKVTGKTTLEQTAGGKYLDDLNLFSNMDGAQAAHVWDIASARFANGASGHINVFNKGATQFGPFGERTWWSVEKPLLDLNSNVTKIREWNWAPKPENLPDIK
jgi:hypothetical protein